jgi:hypothetical protein
MLDRGAMATAQVSVLGAELRVRETPRLLRDVWTGAKSPCDAREDRVDLAFAWRRIACLMAAAVRPSGSAGCHC